MIQKINTREWVKRETKGTLTTFNEHEHLFINGPKGYIMLCSEGVFNIAKSTTKKWELEINKIDPDKVEKEGEQSFFVMPHGTIKFTVAEVLASGMLEHTDELPQNFVRRFGSRLEQNYRTLLKHLEEIGLNPDDYPRN